ncbi:hypothetical protein F4808DRAFT_287452 [Astrocystis sublimbata]|nr:hypothetical protein F4808DRAFT_287452 [Astrocystis sublimbata]
MPRAAYPLFKPKQPTEKATADVEAVGPGGADGAASGSVTPVTTEPEDSHALAFRPPSDRFTLHQIFYLVVLHGIGAAFLGGGINFAVAYALYYDKGGPTSPIRLFQFPNTLAGDTAVTIFIQFASTWIIETIIVNWDLKTKGVQPIGFIPEPRRRFARWFMYLDRPERTDDTSTIAHWSRFVLSQLTRSLLLAAASFPIIFGASVGFLTLVGERHPNDWDWYYDPKWAPQIFKLVQGATLGIVITPLIAMFWLARCGWAMRDGERQPDR